MATVDLQNLQLEAGPSTASSSSTNNHANMRAPSFPCRDLQTLTAIEYPGRIRDEPASVEAALQNLGGLQKINSALHSQDEHRSVIEMNFASQQLQQEGGISFAHPVAGETSDSANLVLKVTRRKRKHASEGEGPSKGLFTVEPAGLVKRSVRFRALADFQYHPKQEGDKSIELARRMKDMDVQSIYDWTFDPPSEDFSSLHLLPPPVFSRLVAPTPYGYKQMPGLVSTSSVNAHGEETTRLINQHRYRGITFATASFNQPGPVPDKPPARARTDIISDEKQLLTKIQALLLQRPMWTRMALLNQLDHEDARKLYNSPGKQLFTLASYQFVDGPFRELVIRFGYDPRNDPEARQFQRIMLRNTQKRGKVPDINFNDETARQNAHVFDGVRVYREVGNYQMCDITDPLLRQLLDTPRFWLTKNPDERSGWFVPSVFENFRELLRRKFVGIINGQPLRNAELANAIERLPTEEAIEEEIQIMDEAQRHNNKTKRITATPAANARGSSEPIASTSERLLQAPGDTSMDVDGQEQDNDDSNESDEESEANGPATQRSFPKRKRLLPAAKNKPRAKEKTVAPEDDL